eukprot:CAMPEP_0114538914 /NCGR_PEP_ID=MMETSP0109-20121206/30406_1 /TAXON_ID=29199 /ORGANISM="Chlorarachnion reptans, Strain CCCM449" /LENGTH=50 /DNA_ID=CAMNT_0001722983 /DNA_START=1911 /DNA_END=2060 /DNA_ORIENTATION=+
MPQSLEVPGMKVRKRRRPPPTSDAASTLPSSSTCSASDPVLAPISRSSLG